MWVGSPALLNVCDLVMAALSLIFSFFIPHIFFSVYVANLSMILVLIVGLLLLLLFSVGKLLIPLPPNTMFVVHFWIMPFIKLKIFSSLSKLFIILINIWWRYLLTSIKICIFPLLIVRISLMLNIYYWVKPSLLKPASLL